MQNYVCEFGNPHPCDKTCYCMKKYKCLPSEFRRKLLQKYGTYVEEPFRGKTRKVLSYPLYSCDITENMRDEVLRELTGTGPTRAFEVLEKRNLA